MRVVVGDGAEALVLHQCNVALKRWLEVFAH